jgi:hypothetical protein
MQSDQSVTDNYQNGIIFISIKGICRGDGCVKITVKELRTHSCFFLGAIRV